jgi:hypothetical protein
VAESVFGGDFSMSTAIQDLQGVFAAGVQPCCASEEAVRLQICSLLAGFRPRSARVERRRDHRYPFPYLLRLTPANADGTAAEGETVVVVGKHVSEQGLGFYHTRPLPYRYMIVSFDTSGGRCLSFLVDLSWCRFTRQGWYESGGRFLQIVSSPSTDR